MSHKQVIIVRGAGQRLRLRLNRQCPIRQIINHLKNQEGLIGELCRSDKYIVSSGTERIKNLQISLFQVQYSFINEERVIILNILPSAQQFPQHSSLTEKKTMISEQKILQILQYLEERDIDSLKEMYLKKQIPTKIFESLQRNMNGRKKQSSQIKNLSEAVQKHHRSEAFQKQQMSFSQSFFSMAGQKKNILDSSKTLENFQDFQLELNGEFLRKNIEDYSKKKIKKLKNIYYDDGNVFPTNFHKKIDGLDNFVVLFCYKKRIFGIYSQEALKLGSEKQRNDSDKGFFFSCNDQLVFYTRKEKVLWEYSQIQLKIGKKFLSMVSGKINSPPKLYQLGKLQETFETQSHNFENITGEAQKMSLQLNSFEFMKVIFKNE